MADVLAGKPIDEVYRIHAPAVFRRARALLGSESDARDVVQEIFITILDAPDAFRGASSLTTWLYSATTHRCLNRLRDARNRSRLLERHVLPMQTIESSGRAEEGVLLREMLARVPLELAEVAVHYFLDEMTHAEIASILGCSRRHVGNLLQRFDVLVRGEEARA